MQMIDSTGYGLDGTHPIGPKCKSNPHTFGVHAEPMQRQIVPGDSFIGSVRAILMLLRQRIMILGRFSTVLNQEPRLVFNDYML